jgi:hypothetical protein
VRGDGKIQKKFAVKNCWFAGAAPSAAWCDLNKVSSSAVTQSYVITPPGLLSCRVIVPTASPESASKTFKTTSRMSLSNIPVISERFRSTASAENTKSMSVSSNHQRSILVADSNEFGDSETIEQSMKLTYSESFRHSNDVTISSFVDDTHVFFDSNSFVYSYQVDFSALHQNTIIFDE